VTPRPRFRDREGAERERAGRERERKRGGIEEQWDHRPPLIST